MRTALLTLSLACIGLAGCAAAPVDDGHSTRAIPDVAWDAAGVARTVDEARRARARGDLMAAERLCYASFEAVDRSTLESLDAYVDLLKARHSDREGELRAQVDRLRQSKASQQQGKQPSSVYLGFSPTTALGEYADLLQALGRSAESQRMRSLALAYQQVQQAHFQRTMLFRQGVDPRGAC
ncbi:MAG: hypothetical protein ABI327_12875 [Burkholderiaceae bacterium]